VAGSVNRRLEYSKRPIFVGLPGRLPYRSLGKPLNPSVAGRTEKSLLLTQPGHTLTLQYWSLGVVQVRVNVGASVLEHGKQLLLTHTPASVYRR
jgi:hypothetical protein